MARPSKLTDDVQRLLIEALTAGASRKAAAEYAGIEEHTLMRWMRRFAHFAHAIRAAEARVEVRAALVIRKQIDGDNWKAAAWWLERRRPDDWGRRDRIDLVATVRMLAREHGLSADEEREAVAEAQRIVREASGGER